LVELKPITQENFVEAFSLKLAPDQEEWVSHPMRSLAQAYVYREQCQPFGIYADGRMVGYVMVIYDYEIPEYDIWHMAIDKAEQGRGYGSEALDRILEFIRTKPFGDSDRVALTCHGDNQVALRLYAKKGFEATGAVYDDEVELAMTIG
jgi:diamine N-acetyltransferase